MNTRQGQHTLTNEEREILQALVKADGPSGANDIAVATGLEPEEIRRQIGRLKQRGLAEGPEGNRYAPTTKTGPALLKDTGRLL